jgi:XTP/dITP diphosphohydrolase
MAASPELRIEPLPGLQHIPPCDETGATFEENAIQKALYYGAYSDGWLFAEDSGLEVDALGGAPGVYSARFAGDGATDGANNALLLERLAESDVRTARYVCVIALVRGGELYDTFRGTVEGEILREPRGDNGFGYDPLFYYAPFGCTFGEVTRDRKHIVSHRGAALRLLSNRLKPSLE